MFPGSFLLSTRSSRSYITVTTRRSGPTGSSWSPPSPISAWPSPAPLISTSTTSNTKNQSKWVGQSADCLLLKSREATIKSSLWIIFLRIILYLSIDQIEAQVAQTVRNDHDDHPGSLRGHLQTRKQGDRVSKVLCAVETLSFRCLLSIIMSRDCRPSDSVLSIIQ